MGAQLRPARRRARPDLDGLGDEPRLIPADPATALQARLWDRLFDEHVLTPMAKIVTDNLRPEGRDDPQGVLDAKATLDTAYAVVDAHMAGREWAAGDAFTVAECAAAPGLFYARIVHRWEDEARPELSRYFDALLARPSVARVIDEAREWRHVFPLPWPDDMA